MGRTNYVCLKNDGMLQFFVDEKWVNSITQNDWNAIPHMDECIDSLGKSTVISTLVAKSGYLQVKIDDR